MSSVNEHEYMTGVQLRRTQRERQGRNVVRNSGGKKEGNKLRKKICKKKLGMKK
jgi:hypothetical protein